MRVDPCSPRVLIEFGLGHLSFIQVSSLAHHRVA